MLALKLQTKNAWVLYYGGQLPWFLDIWYPVAIPFCWQRSLNKSPSINNDTHSVYNSYNVEKHERKMEWKMECPNEAFKVKKNNNELMRTHRLAL